MSNPASDEIVVQTVGLAKKFKRGRLLRRRARQPNLLKLLFGENREDYWALKDISLTITYGEITGIIGRNGSGKTTLAKILAGIYQQSHGEIVILDRLMNFSSLAGSFESQLTVRDNIHMMVSLYELSENDLAQLYPKIIDFSGLAEFAETAVGQLSPGMKQRLSFAVVIHCLKELRPEIIILDEVLGEGGDEGFRLRAEKRVQELCDRRRTVILISHNIKLVRSCCQRVIWLEKGKVKACGEADLICRNYEMDAKL